MPTAQRVYARLGNESLWAAARQCHEVLAAAKIPHPVGGGVAVCLHGYQRNTVDLNLLVRREDSPAIRQMLTVFQSPAGTSVQFVLSGDRAGKGVEFLLPDPAAKGTITEIEGLPVLSLARLIEAKIACGQGNLRRTHKDLADVVELIAARRLNSSFARHLHKSVRATFRELVTRARG